MSTRLRFLYRVIRTSPGAGNGEQSPARAVPARHLYSVVRGIKGVIFDMDGTLTIPVLNFNEMRTRLGLAPGTDILPAVMNMAAEERDRAMQIIRELEEEGVAFNFCEGYIFPSFRTGSRRLQLQPGILELLHLLAQNGIERAVITRNSVTASQVFLDKLRQQLADYRHLYPLLEPHSIFSEVLMHRPVTGKVVPENTVVLYRTKLFTENIGVLDLFFQEIGPSRNILVLVSVLSAEQHTHVL